MPISSLQPANSLRDRIRTALESRERRLILAACVVVVARVWIFPLPSSFWLDETGTVWTIRGSLRDVISHLRNYLFPQTPAYALALWGWTRIAGMSETALRIPSVVASIGSIFGIYALGKELFSRTVALYGVVVLITLSHVDFAADDARPYALAILCLIWTFYFRVRLARTGSLRHAVLYGIGGGLCVHMSYFFAAGLAADVLYLGIAWRAAWVPWRRLLILSWLIAFVLFLPLVPPLRVMTRQSGLHIVLSGTPSWSDLGVSLLPLRSIVAAIFGTAVAWLLAGARLAARLKGERSTLLMILFWAVVPQSLIFVYSLASHHNVFVPRFLLVGAPGTALLAGYLLGCLEPAVWRLSIAGFLVAFSISSQGFKLRTTHSPEDWRAASAVITRVRETQPSIQLFSAGPYVESTRLPMPAESGADYGFLRSPFVAYPIPGDATLLPYEMTPENHPYVESVIETASRENRFLMLFPASSPLLPWVRQRLEAEFQTKTLNADPVLLDVTKR